MKNTLAIYYYSLVMKNKISSFYSPSPQSMAGNIVGVYRVGQKDLGDHQRILPIT